MSGRAESVTLTEAERRTLLRYVRGSASRQSLVLRSRIILACADGRTNAEVARQLSVRPATVARWRARFLADRIDGLADRPRSGAPRRISDGSIAAVVTATVLDLCPSGERWSKRSMARHSGLSPSTVGRIWRAAGLKPHVFRPSDPVAPPDPLLGAVELVALYADPPERMLALCVVREDPVPATAIDLVATRKQASLVRRMLDERPHRDRTSSPALTGFLRDLDTLVPAGNGVHLICDNHVIGDAVTARRWQLGHPRFHLHFTPTREFWSNLVELKLVELAVRESARGNGNSLRMVESALRHNTSRPFRWLRELPDH